MNDQITNQQRIVALEDICEQLSNMIAKMEKRTPGDPAVAQLKTHLSGLRKELQVLKAVEQLEQYTHARLDNPR